MAAMVVESEASMFALVVVLMMLTVGLAAALLAAARADTELVRHGTVRTGGRRASAGRTGRVATASLRRAGGACPEPPTVGHPR